MSYYAYNAPACGFCGQEQGLLEVAGGRQRLYCSDKCRKAAHRKRLARERRNAILQYNSELRKLWQEQNITGATLDKLQDILLELGKPAAQAATEAIVIYARQTREERQRIDRVRAFGL